MTILIPIRVEDRRQQSWLVQVPDLDHEELAGLIRSSPQARFILGNGNGFSGSTLGRKNNGLPANYAVEITWLTAEMANEIGALVESLGEDRLLFGTGMPFHYPGPALAKMEILEVSEAVKTKIRSGNAVRWLGLGR
jgi:predicted TIM-barrel fold metal-dependent hydrolase